MAEGCNVCNTICVVSSVPGHLFAREPRSSKPAHSTRLALSKERTSSAPALITARRRSYFTPRSSIIHAVNNAPLFRVTLYPGSASYLPLCLPSFPSASRPTGGGCESVPSVSGARARGARRIRSGHSYLTDLSTETKRPASVRSFARN